MHIKYLVFLFLYTASNAFAFDWITDRRQDQFPKDQAYLVLPLPYDYPGIGKGTLLLGNVSNLFKTTTDLYLVEVTGDASGHLAQISEIPILTDQLFLSFQIQDINRGIVNNYAIRGMINSSSDDYNLLDLTKADQSMLRLEYASKDRRYNSYIQTIKEDYLLDAVRDSDGNLISQLAQPFSYKYDSRILGISIDLTDDYLDPHKGFRLGLEYTDRPAKTNNDPDYYITNLNFLYYKPIRSTDTLVINYFQSDAHVRTAGNINQTAIKNELNMNCGITDNICLQAELELINTLKDSRTYGTAHTLGGQDRLRSYAQQRFQGAHTGFIGAEYRWNLSSENTPFNYYFWKDTRTAKQIAFFAESGSASDKPSELWNEIRYSYGVGFRIKASSGNVYRIDIAGGDEDTEVAVFFLYPWR